MERRSGRRKNGWSGRRKENRMLEERLRRCLGAREAEGAAARAEGPAGAGQEAGAMRQAAAAGRVPPGLLETAGAQLRERECRRRIGFGAFVLRLLRYEGLRIWSAQALALAGAGLLLRLYAGEAFGDVSARGMAMYLCVFSALAALLSFPLTGRGAGCRMRETELAARYGPARLAAARMLFAGAGNLALLCAVFGMTARTSACGVGSLVFYLLIPFLGAGCLGAGLARILPEGGAPVCWCAIALAAFGGILLAGNRAPEWFEQTFSGGWACVSAVLLTVYADQLRRQCRREGLGNGPAAGWAG